MDDYFTWEARARAQAQAHRDKHVAEHFRNFDPRCIDCTRERDLRVSQRLNEMNAPKAKAS